MSDGSYEFDRIIATYRQQVTRAWRLPKGALSNPGHRIYISGEMLEEVRAVWHLWNGVFVMTRDLLAAEIQLQGGDIEKIMTKPNIWYRAIIGDLTPASGVTVVVVDMPGVLGWGFR